MLSWWTRADTVMLGGLFIMSATPLWGWELCMTIGAGVVFAGALMDTRRMMRANYPEIFL